MDTTMPLSLDSGHHKAILKSWPMAQLRSMAALSSNVGVAEKAKERFIRRFADHFAPEILIQAVTSVSMKPKRKAEAKNTTSDDADQKLCIWFLCGYHPCMQRPS